MKVLLSEEQIRSGVERMAARVMQLYDGRPLTIVGVMTGSVVLLADLIRKLDLPLRVGTVQARSYRGAATEPGALSLHGDLLCEVTGRHVLIVDDIFDTGHTLLELLSHVDELRPASLRSAVLLRKQGRRRVAIEPDIVAFEIPDVFVVGYGLDYADEYRHLPYLAALEPHELSAGGTA